MAGEGWELLHPCGALSMEHMAPGELEQPPLSQGICQLEWGMAGAGIAPGLQPRGGRSREFICARESPGLGYKGNVEAVQLQGVSQGPVQSGVWEPVQGAQSLGEPLKPRSNQRVFAYGPVQFKASTKGVSSSPGCSLSLGNRSQARTFKWI